MRSLKNGQANWWDERLTNNPAWDVRAETDLSHGRTTAGRLRSEFSDDGNALMRAEMKDVPQGIQSTLPSLLAEMGRRIAGFILVIR